MTVIATISFTNPLLLAGMALAALPIVAHLLNRRARRRIVFPTVRLLQESVASQSRLYRLRKWILLSLRCLAICLLAWAFARPVWQEKGVESPTGDSGVAVVLVPDVSASTAQQSGGVSLMTSMKALAGRTLDSLTEGVDMVNIVYASARPRAAFPRLSNNFAALRQELDRLSSTQERANLPEALAMAGTFLKEHRGQKRVVIFSDMQRTNWSDISLKDEAKDLLPTGTRITIVPVLAQLPDNVALSSPRAAPVQPIIHRPFQLQVHVANYSEHARTTPVEATLDGRSIGKQTVALKPWEERDLGFDAQLDKSGAHNVVFSLPPDALAADNQAFLVVQAVARIPVVVVGDDNANQQGTGTYFLTRALAPRGDMGDDLEVRHLTSGDLSVNGFARLGDAEAVMIGYVGKLAPDALRALYMYANQGGGVAIFCGEGPVADNMLSFGALAKQGDCLPWLPTGPRDLSLKGGVLQLGEGDWKHPALADFDEPSQQALKQIRFFKVWLSGAMKPNAVSILKFADGTPALAAQALGQGKMVLANFSPALACSDIGKYGSFVAMVHSMVHYLRPRQDWRSQLLTGEPMRMAIPDSRDPTRAYQVLGPDQRPCEVERTVEAGETNLTVRYPAIPGFYTVTSGEQTFAQAAVNLDPRESDLRRIDPDVVREHLRNDHVSLENFSYAGDSQEGPILRVRGKPMWHWFVVAAMISIGAELVLLGVWKK